jgi:SNF2 family DNA or RNA helicase
MILLHAGVCDDRLLLWAEMSPEERESSARRSDPKPPARVRAPRSRAQHPLPYDAGKDGLAAVLKQAGLGIKTTKGQMEETVGWLPTVGSQPIASSPLIAESPRSRAKTVLQPWTITGLPLTSEQLVDVLCGCIGKPLLAPGIMLGNDLVFWANVLRLAAALVARQQFLPAVRNVVHDDGEDSYRASWSPVFAGTDADLLAQLAKAMPHACRALSRTTDHEPETPALSVLQRMIGEMVDHLAGMAFSGSAVTTVSARRPTRSRQKRPRSFDSTHDQWISSLRSAERMLQGDATELSQLSAQVREWQQPIALASAMPFRLCFRLEEPANVEEEGGKSKRKQQQWSVRYLLQARDDPSLLIPAPDAWQAKERQATVLKRDGFDAQECLLSSLGQAAGICPRIEASLKTAAPSGYQLDSSGAHEFLTEKAILLEQAGFGVLLPAWWTRRGTKLRFTARAEVKSPKMQGGGGLSLESIVEFRWQVALGDEQISAQELAALAKLKQPLVKVRGQWVQMNAEEIQAALAFWKKRGTNKTSVRDVVQMALGTGQTPDGIEFDGVTASGWIADFLAQLDGRATFEELPMPAEFQGTLRPYQLRGYSWLGFLRQWGLGACLADDMGLGKTVETLALLQRDWELNGKQPVLLICPTSVVGNWRKEAERFTPQLPVMIHHGTGRKKGTKFQAAAKKQAIVISSYALLQRDFEYFKNVPWGGVILDEAQNIKNPETKQARAARALEAGYRVVLTGTPVENNVGDLWSLMEFLNPGFLGTQAAFKRDFFVPIQAHRDAEATERLKRLTGPFILRRLKTDKSIITDLPEKMEMKVFCTLTKEQGSLYAAVVEESLSELDNAEGMQRRGKVLGTLSKLKQVCNHPAQFLGDNSAISGRSGKLARLTEMLEEILAIEERALIFSQFAEMGTLLRRHLQETFGREVLFLHGAVSKSQRDRMVERFQSENDDNGPPIFILSLKAGGTGLNLTRANHVFHFDRWWNPAVENQATDRAFRIGQTKNVQVHKFLCAGTLEEKIDEMIERKQEVAQHVVGTGEGWLTELSTTELKDLFALRKDAIGD